MEGTTKPCRIYIWKGKGGTTNPIRFVNGRNGGIYKCYGICKWSLGTTNAARFVNRGERVKQQTLAVFVYGRELQTLLNL
jgi:hypothetical protein